MKLKLDLHDIYNHGGDIDRALRAIIDEAVLKKAPLVEIIPGKGSGALKKHVLRFLDQKEIKASTTEWRRTRTTSAAFSCTSGGSELQHLREPLTCPPTLPRMPWPAQSPRGSNAASHDGPREVALARPQVPCRC